MLDDLVTETRNQMNGALEALKANLGKLRTGRANASLLDGIRVEYYGTPTPLNQLASVSVADARLIVIKPWEKKVIADIEKAVRASDLGINPSRTATWCASPSRP